LREYLLPLRKICDGNSRELESEVPHMPD